MARQTRSSPEPKNKAWLGTEHVISGKATGDYCSRQDVLSGGAFKDQSCGKDVFSEGPAFKDKSFGEDLFS